jgi:hypothetical protein
MPRICIDLSDLEDAHARTHLCREGETVREAVYRIIICEIKQRKLRTELRDGGAQ